MLDFVRAKERDKGTPKEEDLREMDIRKEGIGLLFRTSQRHWEVSKWTETKVDEIGCLLLRLEKEVANSIYGTLNIPVLNHKDPLTAKLIRNSHLMTGDKSQGVHNLTKTTLANLVKGEVAAHWKGQHKQVKKIIQECGVCRRFDERACRPTLGRSLFRCRVGTPPFQHISIDPELWSSSGGEHGRG